MKPTNISLSQHDDDQSMYPHPIPALPRIFDQAFYGCHDNQPFGTYPIPEINHEFYPYYHQPNYNTNQPPPWQSYIPNPVGYTNQCYVPPIKMINNDKNPINVTYDNTELKVINIQRDRNTGEFGIILTWTIFGIIIHYNQNNFKLVSTGLKNFDRLIFINNEPVTNLKKDKIKRILTNRTTIRLTVTEHPLVQYYDIKRQNLHDNIGFSVVDGRYITNIIPYSIAARCGVLENYTILSCNNIESWHNPEQFPILVNKSKLLTLKTIPNFIFNYYFLKYFIKHH